MKTTKTLLLLTLLFLFAACDEQNQEPATNEPHAPDSLLRTPTEISANRYATVDISPMDMSYFPVDYPMYKMANDNIGLPVARVIYSRPHLQKRHLFRDLLNYDETWRLGANESTEIDFYKPVTIQNKKIAAGRYIIYCIPHTNSWTLVLNSNIDSWGLHQDRDKDIEEFEIPISTGHPVLEYFTMVFEKTDTGANLVIAWDDVEAKLPITIH